MKTGSGWNAGYRYKNRTLELAADALMAHEQEILDTNAIDMERGRERNMPQGLLDRLEAGS